MHSMERDRRSVCMFSSNFFTASGLLVDIFDGVFDGNLGETSNVKECGSTAAPTSHPFTVGGYNPAAPLIRLPRKRK